MSSTHLPVWLSIHEACEHTRLTRRTFDELRRKGEIPSHRVSERIVRFDRNELDAWLASHGPEGQQVPEARDEAGRFSPTA